ncbi:MAG: type II toxin-antitoxin system RatA family toxin [Pseudomonadota bacterium]
MPQIVRSALVEAPPSAAYAVVVDVERYPEFLPNCASVQVLETHASGLVAAVTVVGKGLTEQFITSNAHEPDQSVLMTLREGPFQHLEGEWRFTPLGDLGCRIDMRLDFAPRGVLARILSGLADAVANRLVDAFSQRVVQQYQLQQQSE